jgi:hypothetical protein
MQPIARNVFILMASLAIVVIAVIITFAALDYWYGRIAVISATYGGNCGAPAGNATGKVEDECGGRWNCDYDVEVSTLGDPAPGCAKAFTVQYACAAHSPALTANVVPEASHHKVHLSCF